MSGVQGAERPVREDATDDVQDEGVTGSVPGAGATPDAAASDHPPAQAAAGAEEGPATPAEAPGRTGPADGTDRPAWPFRFSAGRAGTFRTPVFWGFAEASFFILIPDIVITFVALFAGWRAGLRAVGWAVVGAMAGGLMVFLAPGAWQTFFPHLPGIPETMMEDAAARFAADGWWAVVTAPLVGIPYKLYAAEAALQGRLWWELVLVTPVARGWRFLLAFLIAWGVGVTLRHRRLDMPLLRWPRAFVVVHLLAWVLVYVRYFLFVDDVYGS